MAAAALPSFRASLIPPVELRSRQLIRFLHPGYNTDNTLLSLPRVDRLRDTAVFGVHHRTALLACQIIAGNAFDTGHFTLDKDGHQLVNKPLDDILTGEEYYFLIGNGPGMY